MQVETCIEMLLLQSSCMASLKLHNKIIPKTSEPHHVQVDVTSSVGLCKEWTSFDVHHNLFYTFKTIKIGTNYSS